MPRLSEIASVNPVRKKICTNNVMIWKSVREEISRLGKDADLNHFDVSGITNFYSLFTATGFCGDVSLWDVSKVYTMENMFAFTEFDGDLSLWDTRSLKMANGMFKKSTFNSDITGWEVGKLKHMRMMFAYSPFNKDISQWQLVDPVDMSYMFYGSEISFCMDELAGRITKDTDVRCILDNTPDYKFRRDVFRKKVSKLKTIQNETVAITD